MFPKITLKPKHYYTTHYIGDSEYLFDGEDLLFEIKNNPNPNFINDIINNKIHFIGIFEMDDAYYLMYIYLNNKKSNIYINEVISFDPLSVL